MSLPADIAASVAAINDAPPRLVYVFAGAGAQALAWLHALGGSSRTILEARDPYAPAALAELLGEPPAQAVGAATASAMAAWAQRRAAELARGAWPTLGVACTAAIATDRVRNGADRACIAVAGLGPPIVYELCLLKRVERHAQEELVSRLVIDAIARACTPTSQ